MHRFRFITSFLTCDAINNSTRKCTQVLKLISIFYFRCGDRLLAVDGHSLENIPHSSAVSMLKQTSTRVVLEVVSWMGTELWRNQFQDCDSDSVHITRNNSVHDARTTSLPFIRAYLGYGTQPCDVIRSKNCVWNTLLQLHSVNGPFTSMMLVLLTVIIASMRPTTINATKLIEIIAKRKKRTSARKRTRMLQKCMFSLFLTWMLYYLSWSSFFFPCERR